jgi:putative transposase
MEWARILAYITGTVDQELLLWNECLLAENRVLKAQLPGRLRLSDAERATLGEIGHRLGRKALSELATAATPDTILAWYRKLAARKFDGSSARRAPGRPPIDRDLEDLIVRTARENRSCGYDRIVGALANLGYEVSDQTVGNVLRRHGIPPAPERKRRTTWAQFIRVHLAVQASTDFLYGGGSHVAKTGDPLRAVLHPSREPQSCYCRHHRSSERAGINLRILPE